MSPAGVFLTGTSEAAALSVGGSQRFEVGVLTRGLAAAVGALGLLVAGAATGAQPIRIGATFGLTGGLASLGGPALDGVKLRVDEINRAGGLLGQPLALETVDTGTNLERTKAAATQLAVAGVAAIVGLTDSDPVLALGPIAQQAGIPVMVVGATSPKLPDQVGDGLFLACFGDNAQAAAGADFTVRRLGLRTAYVLHQTGSEYTTLLAGYFADAFTHDGGDVVGNASYRSLELPGSLPLAEMTAAKPQAIYLAATPEDVGPLVKALRAAGLMQPLIGGDGFDTPLLVDRGGAASEGVVFSTHVYLGEGSSNAARSFADAYRQAYGTSPPNAFAALGYGCAGPGGRRDPAGRQRRSRCGQGSLSGYARLCRHNGHDQFPVGSAGARQDRHHAPGAPGQARQGRRDRACLCSAAVAKA